MLNLNLKICTKSSKVSRVFYRSIIMAHKQYKSPNGPALVIMHDMLGSKQNWNQIALLLYKKTFPRRDIYLLDARNHGDSAHLDEHTYYHMAEDLAKFLKFAGIKKAALLGHSMGGRAMMYFSLIYPELVEKLIVGDVSPISADPNPMFVEKSLEAACKIEMPKHVHKSIAISNVDLQLSKTVSDLKVRKFILMNLQQDNNGKYKWKANVKALLENYQMHLAEFPPLSNQYHGPTLFLAGSYSKYLKKRDHNLIREIFPDAEFKDIPKAGHFIHMDNAPQVLHTCIDFLNK